MTPRLTLLVVAAVANVLLLAKYHRDKPTAADWGSVPPQMHTYILGCAIVAWVLYLAYVTRLLTRGDVDNEIFHIVSASTAGYFGLQLLFFPSIRTGPKIRWPSIVLQSTCVLPIVLLTVVAFHLQDPLMCASASLILAHVLINDTIAFNVWR